MRSFFLLALIMILVSISADSAPRAPEHAAFTQAKTIADFDDLREKAREALTRLQQSRDARVVRVNNPRF